MLRFLFFCFLFLLYPFQARAGVADDPQWLALVHYRPAWFGGVRSTIDSDNFFVSPEGKYSPRKELDATIDLFENGADKEKKCLFPARYLFLRKKGLIDAAFPNCDEFEKFKDDLRPAGVTLLFTDAFMNNPSSLFGHTLLRIDTGRKGTQLLAHGMNYGAFTAGEENGFLFALLGLTGGYYGGFTIKPYYDVINTYNNLENRDIWELSLNLTPEELEMLVAHLWEVGQTQTRYFFFSENCSYMLMETLDAVRPELRLADAFPAQTIPLDTLKEVYAREGLVGEVRYRPSRQSKIRHRFAQMNEAQKKAYFAAVEEQNWRLDGLDDSEKADVLETAYQYIQYRYVAKELDLKDYRKQSFEALAARSRIRGVEHFEELKTGKSPLRTHEAMRAGAGFGTRNGQAFQEISFRPAYHSLTDRGYGFLRGAEINFLNASFRHYDNTDKYVLHKLEIAGVRSLSPADRMFVPPSFAIGADISRVFNPENEEEGYAFNFQAGGGITLALTETLWTYGMINSYVSYGGFLPHNQWAGLGAAAGIFADFGRLRLLAEAEKVWATSHFAPVFKYRAEASYSLTTNTAAALTYVYDRNYGHDLNEFAASFRLYF